MTTVEHPNKGYYKKGYKATLTTYDSLSRSPAMLKYSFSMGKRLPSVSKKDIIKTVGYKYTLPST